MRVLFLAGACPYPPNSGGTMRTYNLLKYLCRYHDITLICPSAHGVDLNMAFDRALAEVVEIDMPQANLWRRLSSLASPKPYIVSAHENGQMARAVQHALARERHDLLHCDSVSAVTAIPPRVGLPMFFNAHNVEAVIWERYVSEERRPWMRAVLRSQTRKVRAFEHGLARLFDGLAVVSEEDGRQMRARYGIANASVIANGVDLDFYCPSADACSPAMVFVGSWDWRPNQDAARWFCDHVWPLIRLNAPDARVSLIGRRPPPWMRRLCSRNGIILRADVADVRPYLRDAALVIVPLRIGGGSRLKILEAMAAGRCVLSTAVGAEGLEVTDGRDIVIADDPSAFAREAVALLRDTDRRRALARSGRELVESKYGWDKIARQMETAWMDTADRGRRSVDEKSPANERQ